MNGPVQRFDHSFGGWLAFTMAQQFMVGSPNAVLRHTGQSHDSLQGAHIQSLGPLIQSREGCFLRQIWEVSTGSQFLPILGHNWAAIENRWGRLGFMRGCTRCNSAMVMKTVFRRRSSDQRLVAY